MSPRFLFARPAAVLWLVFGLVALRTVSGAAQEADPKLPSLEENRAAQDDSDPIEPSGRIVLFNGKDFTGLTTWHSVHGYDAPEEIYRVTEGMIHIRGEQEGYIRTNQRFRNYHVSVEYKWGKHRTNPSDRVRNSGLLLNGSGIDGGASGRYMASIECQLAQGREGDAIGIGGRDRRGEPVRSVFTGIMKIGEDRYPRWNPTEGEPLTYSGRQFWWSKHDPEFQNAIDTRGRFDVASPLGEWTRVEAICWQDTVTIKVNGETVMQLYDVHPSSGYILLQNEKYEIYFRNFEVGPVAEADRFAKPAE